MSERAKITTFAVVMTVCSGLLAPLAIYEIQKWQNRKLRADFALARIEVISHEYRDVHTGRCDRS